MFNDVWASCSKSASLRFESRLKVGMSRPTDYWPRAKQSAMRLYSDPTMTTFRMIRLPVRILVHTCQSCCKNAGRLQPKFPMIHKHSERKQETDIDVQIKPKFGKKRPKMIILKPFDDAVVARNQMEAINA